MTKTACCQAHKTHAAEQDKAADRDMYLAGAEGLQGTWR